MWMPARTQGVLSMLLAQIPTVLTLGVLGGVALCGYAWDWKLPSLSVLLGRVEPKKDGEEKKPEEESASKTLAPVKLDSEEALKTAGITTTTVQEQKVGEYVTANGEIDFDQNLYAHLSSRASGTAFKVFKRAGDAVQKGDVLALIASPELARIKFDLQQTVVMVETREQLLRRMKSAGTATPAQQIDTAEASLREARIRLFGDVQSLQNLGLTIQPEDLAKLTDEQIAARLRTLGIRDSLLQDLDAATLTNNLLPMYAPFDGTVIKRDIVNGEIVNTTTPQFVLADLSKLWIILHIRLEDAVKVKQGKEMTFHLEAFNQDVPPAEIKWISAEVDEKTHTILARAEVDNKDGLLRPHSFGTGRIRIVKEKRLTVPNAALQWDASTSHLVFVQGESPTEFQPTRVTLGTRHDNFVEILSGLRAGQRVALDASHVLLSEMLKERIGGED
jgi:cobalt-zinc-cadmium efflux system membrane fusion protein